MLQQLTRSELQSFNRTQLWALCRERGLKCYPKTADCVEAICKAQEPVEKVAVAEIKAIEHSDAQDAHEELAEGDAVFKVNYLKLSDSYSDGQSIYAERSLEIAKNEQQLEYYLSTAKQRGKPFEFETENVVVGADDTDLREFFIEHGFTQMEPVPQSQVSETVPTVTVDDPSAATRAELETHVKVKASSVAPEIHTVEITFYDHEIYAGDKQIASITHDPDDFQTQRWVVMVGETEVHRADSWAKCFEYVRWHYKQGTLPSGFAVAYGGKPSESAVSPVVCEVQCEPEPSLVIEFDNYKLVYDGGENPRDYKVYLDCSPRGLIWQWSTHWSNGIDNVQHAEPHSAAVALCEWFDKPPLPVVSYEELLDKPFDELTVEEWERIKRSVADISSQLDEAYMSDNFGCHHRIGGRVRGNEFLKKERRRVASGELVMVCCDIAGLGKRNSLIGEAAVNQAVRECLNQIRSMRGIHFISQLNSGDEFVFIVDRVDAKGIIPRMNDLFKSAGFEGIYGAVEPLGEDYIKSANDGMELVYKLKQFTKTFS